MIRGDHQGSPGAQRDRGPRANCGNSAALLKRPAPPRRPSARPHRRCAPVPRPRRRRSSRSISWRRYGRQAASLRAAACCPAARSVRSRRDVDAGEPVSVVPVAAEGLVRAGPAVQGPKEEVARSPSPVKMRPVRLPPCAAGARPTTSTRRRIAPARHGPAPVIRPGTRRLDPRGLLAPRHQPRTEPARHHARLPGHPTVHPPSRTRSPAERWSSGDRSGKTFRNAIETLDKVCTLCYSRSRNGKSIGGNRHAQ